MSHAAPTDWMSPPKLEVRLASHTARKIPCLNGAKGDLPGLGCAAGTACFQEVCESAHSLGTGGNGGTFTWAVQRRQAPRWPGCSPREKPLLKPSCRKDWRLLRKHALLCMPGDEPGRDTWANDPPPRCRKATSGVAAVTARELSHLRRTSCPSPRQRSSPTPNS